MSEAGNDKLLKKEMVLNVFAIDIIPGVPEVIATIIKDFVETAPIPTSSSSSSIILASPRSSSSSPPIENGNGNSNHENVNLESNAPAIGNQSSISRVLPDKVSMNVVFNQPKRLLQIMFEHIDQSDVILLLLTKDTFLRPHTLLLLDYAIKRDKPIVSVNVEGEGHTDDLMIDNVQNLSSRLSSANCDLVKNQSGKSIQEVSRTILNAFSTINPTRYNFRDSRIVKNAFLQEIFNEILSSSSSKRQIQRISDATNQGSTELVTPYISVEPDNKKQRSALSNGAHEGILSKNQAQLPVKYIQLPTTNGSNQANPSRFQFPRHPGFLKLNPISSAFDDAQPETQSTEVQGQNTLIVNQPAQKQIAPNLAVKPMARIDYILDRLKAAVATQDPVACKIACDNLVILSEGPITSKEVVDNCIKMSRPWLITFASACLSKAVCFNMGLSLTCLKLLKHLSRVDNIRVHMQGRIQIIMNGIVAFSNDSKYLETGCALIDQLANDKTFRADLVNHGAIDLCLHFVKTCSIDNREPFHVAIHALWTLSLNPDAQSSFISKGADAIILSLFSKYISDAEVQKSLCGITVNLLHDSPTNREEFIKRGIIPHLVQTLKVNQNAPNVVKNACAVLWNLIVKNSDVAVEFVKSNVVSELISSLAINIQDVEIVQFICGVLWAIAQKHECIPSIMKPELGIQLFIVLNTYSTVVNVQRCVYDLFLIMFKTDPGTNEPLHPAILKTLYTKLYESHKNPLIGLLKNLGANIKIQGAFSKLCEIIFKFIQIASKLEYQDQKIALWVAINIIECDAINQILSISKSVGSVDNLRILEVIIEHFNNLGNVEMDVVFTKCKHEHLFKFINGLSQYLIGNFSQSISVVRGLLLLLNQILYLIASFKFRHKDQLYLVQQEKMMKVILDSAFLVDIANYLSLNEMMNAEIQLLGYKLVCLLLSLCNNPEKKLSFIQEGYADNLISCVQSFQQDHDFQSAAFRALWSLSSVDKHYMSKDEVLILALNALNQPNLSGSSIFHALSFILSLIDNNERDEQLSPQNRVKLKQMELLPLLMKMMSSNPNDEQIQYVSCMILQHYASLQENTRILFIDLDVIQILLNIMTLHVSNEKLMNIAAKLLWNIICCVSEERLELASTQVKVEPNTESSVMDLTSDDPQERTTESEVMKTSSNDLSKQESSPSINEGILNDVLSVKWMSIWQQICLRVVELMTLNKTNVILQEILLGTVKSIISQDENMVLGYLMTYGIVDILIASMKTFPASGVIQYNCCVILWALTLKNQTRTEEILNKNAVPCVILAMKNHPNDVDVQKQSCSLFWSMGNQENGTHVREVLIDLGVVDAIVGYSMEKQLDDAETQANAMGALKYILMDDAARVKALDKTKLALKAILNAMEVHKDKPEVQQYGCGVLRYILMPIQGNIEGAEFQPPYHNETDNEAIAKALLFALQFHVGNVGVLKNAAAAISKLGATSSNLYGIREAMVNQGVKEALVQLFESDEIDKKSKKILKKVYKDLFT